ncbi:MAG: hypothetical protein KH230_13450 [Enterocloster asparagiformis]|nr:hypothetical protein [Enterocloster asparagiformis]
MITIFNRKEVFSTFSMEAQSKARAALERYGIDYIVNTSGGMARNYGSGSIAVDRFGTNPSLNIQYRIYVKKTDIEKAAAAVAGKLDRL